MVNNEAQRSDDFLAAEGLRFGVHENMASPTEEANDFDFAVQAPSWRESNGSDDSGIAAHSPVPRKGFASMIDPDLRERIAHPKQRVFIDDGPPQDNVLFMTTSKRPAGKKSTNISLVRGEDTSDSDSESEKPVQEPVSHSDTMPRVPNEDCTMYMLWGFCFSGDHCDKRHPTSRHPCPPPWNRFVAVYFTRSLRGEGWGVW